MKTTYYMGGQCVGVTRGRCGNVKRDEDYVCREKILCEGGRKVRGKEEEVKNYLKGV